MIAWLRILQLIKKIGRRFADGGLSWRMRVILIVREKSAAYQNGSNERPYGAVAHPPRYVLLFNNN